MNLKEMQDIFAQMGVVWPGQHPVTKGMLVACTDIRQARDIQKVYRMRPMQPRKHEPCEWSDEGHVIAWLDRTDEELTFAMAQWERDCAQHERDRGLTLIPGRTQTWGSFHDEEGAVCAGEYDPSTQQWHWTASTPGLTYPAPPTPPEPEGA